MLKSVLNLSGNTLLGFICILFINFLLTGFLLMGNKWVGIDSFYHFFISRIIRKHKRLPVTIRRFYVPEKYSYPPLFHVFLSLFREKNHNRLQFLGPFLSIVMIILLFYLGVSFFNEKIALFSAVIFAVTPFSIGISYTASIRSLGNLFLTLSFGFLLSFLLSQTVITFVLSLFFGSLVFLTHRLALQSWIFALILLGLVLKSIFPFLLLVGGFFLATLLSKGFYVKVLREHFNILRFRVKYGDMQGKKGIGNPFIILFNFPFILLTPLVFFINHDFVSLFFIVWALSTLLLSFLWVIGEGYRHLINGIVPFSIVLSLVVLDNLFIFLTLAAISLVFSLIKVYRMAKNQSLVISENLLESFRFLNSCADENDLLLCLPPDFTYAALYFVECKLLQGSGGDAEGEKFNVGVLRPMIKGKKVKELLNQFGVKWIIDLGNCDYGNLGEVKFRSGQTKVWRAQCN